MSDEPKNFYYHDQFHENHQDNTSGSNMYADHKVPSLTAASSSPYYNLQAFDPTYMSFSDGLQGSFGLSPSLSEVFSSVQGNYQKPMDGGDVSGGHGSTSHLQASPNSSVSSSSTEAAAADEDSTKSKKDGQLKVLEDGGESSKKVNKSRKKGEKRQKEQRFAFMTKSEVDHLEDGYRWRKYGQKAVKNSPYPRSYYRCTTQKCTVKKRVERSYQDPSTVITTYEGQHNHPIPATLRGNAGGMYASSLLTRTTPLMSAAPSFPPDFFLQMPPVNSQGGGGSVQQYHHQFPDYGLLQDIVPSMFFKQQP